MDTKNTAQTTDKTRAKTVKDARRMAREARWHFAYVVISPDEGIYVRLSRAAVLDALKQHRPESPCGGSLRDGTFILDRYF